MAQERGEIYREAFTLEERRALKRAAAAPLLRPEAELLRVLIRRELHRERSDDERLGRLIDRLVRVVRAQQIGDRANGRDPRVDEMIGWLAEIGRRKREAAAAGRVLAELPEAGR